MLAHVLVTHRRGGWEAAGLILGGLVARARGPLAQEGRLQRSSRNTYYYVTRPTPCPTASRPRAHRPSDPERFYSCARFITSYELLVVVVVVVVSRARITDRPACEKKSAREVGAPRIFLPQNHAVSQHLYDCSTLPV